MSWLFRGIGVGGEMVPRKYKDVDQDLSRSEVSYYAAAIAAKCVSKFPGRIKGRRGIL